MPAVSLKTKVVAAITGLVAAIVATLSALYISEVVHQRIQEAYSSSLLICDQVFAVARDALAVDLTNAKIDMHDPVQVTAAMEEVLQTDSELNALLDSAVGNSPTIYDATITDALGQALLHSNAAYFGKALPHREEFASFVNGGIRKQLKVIYGPAQVYDVRLPLLRDGKPFGEVRVGVSTVFLKDQVQGRMRRALLLSGAAIFICLVVAAAVPHPALPPFAAIHPRPGLISVRHDHAAATLSKRSRRAVP